MSSMAQTFAINTVAIAKVGGTGAYATRVDIFFATKSATMPAIVELREVDQASGSITGRVAPFSRVSLDPDDVNVSNDGSAPTPFYFQAPVFLQNGVQYAIVVRSGGNSPDYRVFISRLGAADLVTGNRVTTQPAAGVLLASSNESTFTALQEEDLKFTLYVAEFDRLSTARLVLKNENRDYLTVANLSGEFLRAAEVVHGETLLAGTFANTKSVNVGVTYAQGVVSGATGTVRFYSSANGHLRVSDVSLAAKFKGGERIRIRNTNATTGVIVGNSTGAITSATYPTGRVSYYDPRTASNTYLYLSNTSFANSGAAATPNRLFLSNRYIRGQANGSTARIVSLDRLEASLANFNFDHLQPANTYVAVFGKFATADSTRDSAYLGMNVNEDTVFADPRYVLSRSTESNTSASSAAMAGARSAEVAVAMASMNRLASPAVDLRRTSLIIVQNLVNSNSAIATSEDAVAQGGNAKARYITRRVELADGQDAEDIRVYLTAYKPPTTNIAVYYKVLHREDAATFVQATWTPMTQTTGAGVVSDDQNQDDFKEYLYEVPAYSTANKSGANTTNSNILEYRSRVTGARFVGFKYMAIKIVLMADSPTLVPRVRDLRVIALQR